MKGEPRLRFSVFMAEHLEALGQLIEETIERSYAGVYGPGARRFFKDYHCRENILKDAATGYTILAWRAGELAGTGTLVGEDIRRVFINPGCQRNGIGRLIMAELESQARSRGLRRVSLSASLPALEFYRRLGYSITAEACEDCNGDPLRYYEMAKEL